MLINEIYKELLLENVSLIKINDAIDKTYEVMINYHSRGENIATGERIIQPVAYGLTKAGNPVIRAFQPYGDTRSKVPSWKFFRVDRITFWKGLYNKKFKEPPGMYNAEGTFNPNGDKSMSIVYKIASFNNTKNNKYNNIGAVYKNNAKKDDIYKTDSELKIKKLLKQLDNPKYLPTINNSGPVVKNDTNPNAQTLDNKSSGPILKNNLGKNQDLTYTEPESNNDEKEVYKTETERGIQHLMNQLNNPKYISDIVKNKNFGQNNKSTNGPVYK